MAVEMLIDGVRFTLREDHDFSWLSLHGRVFRVFDQQDSGNICFGVDSGNGRLFVKYAGAATLNYDGSPDEAVSRLKSAIPAYEEIRHPSLIRLIGQSAYGDGHALIFDWADGECLHAHWDFERRPKYSHPQSPNFRLAQLGLEHKLACLDTIFDVHRSVAEKGYVAIDFYDGSVMYDFDRHRTTICDIDFYRKSPYRNTMGRMWGSSRFMSPEEYQLGALIDEVTNVYAMGAIAFEILGDNSRRTLDGWRASAELFQVAKRATSPERDNRYQSISAFCAAWNECARAR